VKIPSAADANPIITTCIAVLFVLGMLWRGYVNMVKVWIHSKVAES
jgi:hypothetical protein